VKEQGKIAMPPAITLTDRLKNCYSGAVYDVLRAKGYVKQTLPHYLRPLNLEHKLAGPVFTIEGRRDDSLDAHESLLKWCDLLSKAPANTVLVCQPHDHTLAHMGELSSETLAYKKVLGYIVDGGCRDSAFIETLGFPVFCKYFTPVDVVGKWAATALGEAIQIGDVTVLTGDYVLADRDGIVIIPTTIAAEVVEQTEEVLRTENLVRKAILQGVDPVAAYLQHGKF
jgi:4-hydroxy-4-methyl-2-oxoglutarate aldolase